MRAIDVPRSIDLCQDKTRSLFGYCPVVKILFLRNPLMIVLGEWKEELQTSKKNSLNIVVSIYSQRSTINVSRKSSSPFCLSFYYPHSRLLLLCRLYPPILFVLSTTMNKHLCLSSTRWHHLLAMLSPNTIIHMEKKDEEEERRIHTHTHTQRQYMSVEKTSITEELS